MKTAISVPDETFDRVERWAKRLGVSRSEFFARAAAHWADELESSDLTDAINNAIDAGGDDDTEFVGEAARRTFDRSDG